MGSSAHTAVAASQDAPQWFAVRTFNSLFPKTLACRAARLTASKNGGIITRLTGNSRWLTHGLTHRRASSGLFAGYGGSGITHVLVNEPFDDPRLSPRFFFPKQPVQQLTTP